MSVERPDPVQWNKVAAELQAARETQRRTWGDIDNAALGRYLADEASSSERAAIEIAFETLPELKLLTDLVRGVLVESAPAIPVATPVSAPGRIAETLPFRHPVPHTPKSRWAASRGRVAILAAACLFLALGGWLLSPGLNHPSRPTDLKGLGEAEARNNRSPLTLPNERQASAAAPVELAFAEIDKLQRQIEDNEKTGDVENALAAANTYFTVAENHELENSRRFAPKVAEGWKRVGLLYSTEGDIDRAERALAKANDINRKWLGETDPATRQTCYHLANVYQDGVVLRAEAAGAPAMMLHSTMMKTSPSSPSAAKDDKAYHQARAASLAAFRTRMTSPEMQNRVRTDVVPVLQRALQEAPTAPERARLAMALGNLGSLAQDAAPTVEDCLAEAKDPAERFALVRALNQMGPPSDRAVPVLVQTFKQCETRDVRQTVANYLAQAPKGKAHLDEFAEKGKAEEQKCAREALQRPRGGQ